MIPKSVHPEPIEENSRIFDFALEQADVDALSAPDTSTRIGPNPDTIDFYIAPRSVVALRGPSDAAPEVVLRVDRRADHNPFLELTAARQGGMGALADEGRIEAQGER